MGRQTGPQGGTGFRMLRAQFWTLAQSKYISEGLQKWTLLGFQTGPSWRACFWSLHFVRCAEALQRLCDNNVKLEATLTQRASAAGILNWGGPYLRLYFSCLFGTQK